MEFSLIAAKKHYSLLILFLFASSWDALAQRIIPTNYRWTNTIGAYGSVNYSTGYQFAVSPTSGTSEALLGYGGGIKFEYQTSYKTRFEFAGGYQQRNYIHTEAPLLGLPPKMFEVNTSFLSFYSKYKLLTHNAFFSLYAAPGITLDLELNHPLLNRNSSGLGLLFSIGFEKRIGKKWIFYSEAEARLQSLIHFKNEEFPYRHIGVQANMGFAVIL